MMNKLYIGLLLVFLVLYIFPLNVRPLVSPDETRYAEIPREMIATGDWVTPHFNGLRYFEKPVMGYWLNALSIKAFGENAFAVRFPSAVAAGLSCLAVFLCVFLFTRNAATGLMASGIFLTSLQVFGIGVFSILDSMVSFFLTASMVSFFIGWINRRSTYTYILFLALSGLFCGFACHTKGFLAFVIPVAVIVPFVLWEKEWKQLFIMPWIPLITAALVLLPWGLMIHHKEPDFWNFFFWNEHVRRFLAGDGQHKKSFFYFFFVLPLGALPWTALWPAALSGFGKDERRHSLFRFSVCWFIFPFLFFSVCAGKLATYILPCFAPLSILIALGIAGYFKQGKTITFNVGAIVITVLFIVLYAEVVAIQAGMVQDVSGYSDQAKGDLLLMVLVIFAGFVFLSVITKSYERKMIFMTAAPLLFYIALHFLVPDQVILEQSPVGFLEQNKPLVDEHTVLVSSPPPVGAVCWVYKRHDVYMLMGGGELDYGLNRPDSKHRLLNFDQFNKLVQKNKGVNRVVLVIDSDRFSDWRKELPEPGLVKTTGKGGYTVACY